MVCQLSLFYIFLYVFIHQNPVLGKSEFWSDCTCSFGEVMHPSRLVIFNSWLQAFSWFLNTAVCSVPFVFPFPHFPWWLFQTYPHSPHKFFLLSQLPSSFTTDYLYCLTEKSKAFKWETPQFTATKSPNLFMFCSYSQPAFQLTVEEITFCVPSCVRLSFYFCLILLF